MASFTFFLCCHLLTISAVYGQRHNWYDECRPLDTSLPLSTIDAVVRISDNKVFVFSGEKVSKVSISDDIRHEITVEHGWPRHINDVWPKLEPHLTTSFNIDNLVFFVKHNKIWTWSSKDERYNQQGPFPLDEAFPFFNSFGTIESITSLQGKHSSWLLVVHSIKGQQRRTIIDTETSKVISTQLITSQHKVLEMEIIKSNVEQFEFRGIEFGDRTHRLFDIRDNEFAYIDCEYANEPLISCPTPLCSPSFRLNALTQVKKNLYAIEYPFVYVINADTMQLLDISIAEKTFAPISDHFRVNASFYFDEQMFILSGQELISFQLDNNQASKYIMKPVSAIFEDWPNNTFIDAAFSNDDENSLIFIIKNVYWKYQSSAIRDNFINNKRNLRNLIGVGLLEDWIDTAPSSIDAAFYDEKNKILNLIKWPGVVQIKNFGKKSSESQLISLLEFFKCPKKLHNKETHPCTSKTTIEPIIFNTMFMKSKTHLPSFSTNDIRKWNAVNDVQHALDNGLQDINRVILNKALQLNAYLDRMPNDFNFDSLVKDMPGIPSDLPEGSVERALRNLAKIATTPSFRDMWRDKTAVGQMNDQQKADLEQQTGTKRSSSRRSFSLDILKDRSQDSFIFKIKRDWYWAFSTYCGVLAVIVGIMGIHTWIVIHPPKIPRVPQYHAPERIYIKTTEEDVDTEF